MAAQSAATAILSFRLRDTIVARSFGISIALDRIRRFAHAQVDPKMPLDDFILYSLNDTPISGLLAESIAFCTYGALALHGTDQVIFDEVGLGWSRQPWCALDLIDLEPELIVPTRLFSPFKGTKRRDGALQRTDMLPLFFKRYGGGVGVSIAADADSEAIPNAPTRVSGTSLKVILNLPNYTSDERQIQLRCPEHATVSARRLFRLVATKVRNSIEKADRENAAMTSWENPRWKFGTGVDCIKVGDVILLGIIFVSPGKVTPLLKLRSGYNWSAPFNGYSVSY